MAYYRFTYLVFHLLENTDIYSSRYGQEIFTTKNQLLKEKIYAYILREINSEYQLLIFAHRDFPEGGIQIPGGTLEKDETLIDGILREVKEEAGLSDFDETIYLGKTEYWSEGKNEFHKRHYFQLTYGQHCKNDFVHNVNGNGEDKGLTFIYKWERMENLPTLAGDLGEMVHKLIR